MLASTEVTCWVWQSGSSFRGSLSGTRVGQSGSSEEHPGWASNTTNIDAGQNWLS